MILPPPRPKEINTPWTRKHLSYDPLIQSIREWAEGLRDHRRDPDYTLADTIMSAFALFSWKAPSLLAFQQRHNAEWLRTPFKEIAQKMQRGKALEAFVFHEGYYLLAWDGTEHSCSDTIHCPSCLCRESKTGKAGRQQQERL